MRETIAGRAVSHKAAFANPEALDLYKNLPELQGYWTTTNAAALHFIHQTLTSTFFWVPTFPNQNDLTAISVICLCVIIIVIIITIPQWATVFPIIRSSNLHYNGQIQFCHIADTPVSLNPLLGVLSIATNSIIIYRDLFYLAAEWSNNYRYQ